MRRQTMGDGENEDEYNSSQLFMKNSLQKSSKAKNEELESTGFSSLFNAIEISDDEGEPACDLPSTSNPVIETPSSKPSPADRTENAASVSRIRPGPASSSSSSKTTDKALGLGRLVQEEMSLRRRESLGLVGGRKLGGASEAQKSTAPKASPSIQQKKSADSQTPENWVCLVCIL